MKSVWLTTCVLAAIAVLDMTQARTDEPVQALAPATDLMRGKEPGEVRDDNGLKMKLVWCPPGVFEMGSPPAERGRLYDENQVSITLTHGFWLGKYEVTQAELKQVMGTEPWKEFVKDGAEYPATYVNWDDAMQFCRKLTELERKAGRLPTGWEYTLPSEAQWERACRARTETIFSFGNDESKLGEYAWFRDNAGDENEQFAHPVGRKKANPWGLHDMHSNVWEWCRDEYEAKLLGGRDPEVRAEEKTKTSIRVVRGGSWLCNAMNCYSAFRGGFSPGLRCNDLGFRVALSSVQPIK